MLSLDIENERNDKLNVIEIGKSSLVQDRFPDVRVFGVRLFIDKIKNKSWNEILKTIHEKWRGKSRSDVLNGGEQKYYADFMRSLGVDIKKQPPSVANLIIRCLIKNDIRFPNIHPVVDAVNISAVQTEISLGVFDAECVEGNLQLSFSKGGEKFLGLGADNSIELEAGILILRDTSKVLSLFSVRDSQSQAIRTSTRSVWLLACQVPGITQTAVFSAIEQAVKNLESIGVQYEQSTAN
ncbi:phenylalanine--tRNA ligase beta subunit-related protein [Brenneria tiliae]|uniref:phenylalanine--tRNA ligase beta subunit-related protein n=1 Tax=Brenneria tiliae TaxID=2914984 RepID=UPI00201495B3|nr:phenylalanine--tRNA ligase beta subunit-related protein [Brenneria tiliae]MCL2897125.1 hypothetical protein [Brenneria tiliae]MCL2904778.1 hypothetical protein [Brenneria tiliae]